MGGGHLLKTIIVLLISICFILPSFINILVYDASARADIYTMANRSTRHYLPMGYDVNGTAAKKIVDWEGARAVGNVGIGDGRLKTLVRDTTLEELMLPAQYMQGTIRVNEGPSSIIYKEPPNDIFTQFTVQPGSQYCKLVGLIAPGGNNVDIGIRSLGYAYVSPETYLRRAKIVEKIIRALANQTA
ncbi:hypothetical protein CUJ83_03955 [Methanocella sp. CWC-04]|uniref:Uncharacterized protein n=1 Tax=Methanooceanicella nereidis TaxID=2052831 RepID=A0AAP2W5F8_9EURY|nr:hypothetical protein [Methanocella sp. CWC-04]MCD1294147.1 hypothetical protein [Methanocella sp. CWC-04]